MITITINKEISSQTIADLMITVIEGGSGYWCEQILPIAPTVEKLKSELGDKYERPWYANAAYYDNEFCISVCTDEDESFLFTNHSIQQGFAKLSIKHMHILNNIVSEDYDADDADVWFQMCLFGDVVYG